MPTHPLIRKMLDLHTDTMKTIMVAPFDDEMDAPTRRYMVVSEIEEKYFTIYEEILERFDSDEPPHSEILVNTAERITEDGGVLPSFMELPADVQEVIWFFLDSEDRNISESDLELVAKQVRMPEPIRLRPEDLPERPFGAPADYYSPHYMGPEPAI